MDSEFDGGSHHVTAVQEHLEIGAKSGEKVLFTPMLQAGVFSSGDIEIGAYLTLNIGIGFAL